MASRPNLSIGATGPAVEEVQSSLGLPVDGQFGPVTEAGVEGFQAGVGLSVDGVVGQTTWVKLDELDNRMANGSDGLSEDTAKAIAEMAAGSPASSYSWKDRGRAPSGYIEGMAQTFGLAATDYFAHDVVAVELAKANSGNESVDALAWYADQFAAKHMSNSVNGLETLRHLFVLLTGLGMRESSGKYYEGRDMSADNVSSTTAEAGLFQTSWNIKSCSSLMGKIYSKYCADPNGFLPTFSEAIYPTAAGLRNYGGGEGASYQWLAKYSPAFAAFVTALGLRKLRQHWGPINRHEVELVTSVDDLFKEVQALIEASAPEPIPPEPSPVVTVDLTIPQGIDIVIKINGVVML